MGNHLRRRIRIIRRRNGRGVVYYEKEELECEDIMNKDLEEIDYLSLLLLIILSQYLS